MSNPLDQLKDPRYAQLAHRIKDLGGRLLLVGGKVREALVYRELGLNQVCDEDRRLAPAQGDRDLVVFGLELTEIQNAVAGLGPAWIIGHRTLSDRKTKEPSLVNVRLDDNDFTLSQSRRVEVDGLVLDPRSSLREDALSRDFTVNAIYFDPLPPMEAGFIDPLDGLSDLRARRLELCSPPGLAADPLRILRAMGFISRLGFTAGPHLLSVTARCWPQLDLVPLERLWPEWRKWAASRYPRFGLDFLKDSGAIAYWPDLLALIGSPQRHKFHPEGDAWSHTLLVVEAMSRLDLPLAAGRVFLTMASLLHDIGKPLVTKVREDGSVSTRGHTKAGLPLAKRFLGSILAPSHVQKAILRVIERHMDLSFREPTTLNLRILARRLAPFCDLSHFWAMAAADWNGRSPLFESYPWSLVEFLEPVAGERGPGPIPLEARDLMCALGLSGGPAVGRLMDILTRAFDCGRIATRDQALELAATALADPDFDFAKLKSPA
jgi:tRNA nucleotidyltransferase (CCA-adding enzyme)